MPFQVNDKVIYTYNDDGNTDPNYKVIEVNGDGTYTIQYTKQPTSDGIYVKEFNIPEDKLKKKGILSSMFSGMSGMSGNKSGGRRRKSRKTKRSRKSRKSRKSRRKMTKRRRR